MKNPWKSFTRHTTTTKRNNENEWYRRTSVLSVENNKQKNVTNNKGLKKRSQDVLNAL